MSADPNAASRASRPRQSGLGIVSVILGVVGAGLVLAYLIVIAMDVDSVSSQAAEKGYQPTRKEMILEMMGQRARQTPDDAVAHRLQHIPEHAFRFRWCSAVRVAPFPIIPPGLRWPRREALILHR